MIMESKCYDVQITTVSEKCDNTEEKIYDYEEAIDITGSGWYHRYMMIALGFGLLGMGIDVFGFSIIVTGSTCDFQLELWQKSILLSMPFIGPLMMSIPWGFISDTQGRRITLLITLYGGFLSSFIGAFSFNWIMLAVFKVLSSMFCCAIQPTAYALLGESSSRKVRDYYLLIITSVLLLYMTSYMVPGYFILQLDFDLNLGSIHFTPWRLLAMVLASPLAIAATMLYFCCESPKFLVGAGRETQALDNLRMIWTMNGGKKGEYPVHRIILRDDSKVRDKNMHILKSLWQQIAPLFKPPMLQMTLHLFFITAVIYSINNCWVMWLPAVVEAFSSGINLNANEGSQSLCSIISRLSTHNSIATEETITCSHSIQSFTLLSGGCQGVVVASITLLVSKWGHRKKYLLITFLVAPMLSSVAAVFNQNNIGSLLLFVGMTMSNLCIGIMFAFYVDMYPTSYRGMATCLGGMMGRLSGVAGVNLLGAYVMTHCTVTFYATAIILLAGIIVASYFLPSGKSTKHEGYVYLPPSPRPWWQRIGVTNSTATLFQDVNLQ